jgi:phospholipid/cholesterol/gamma-HCH transport system substrate-binding protein
MPAPKKRTEVFVGLFLFTGLSLLGGLVLQFGSFADRLRGHYTITVVFDDASGVIKGSEVRMGGARIGEVASLPELNDALKVEVELSIKAAIRIPAGSAFQIESATLLGDKLIVAIPPDDRTNGFIAAGDRIEGAGPTGLDAIQNNAEIVSKDIVRILKEAEATLVKVDAAVDEIKGASTQLGVAVGKINTGLLSDKNLANIDSTLNNLDTTTAAWKDTSRKLEPTLEEARDAIQAIKTAAAGAEKILKSADQTLAEVKPALKKLPRAVDEFSSAVGKAGDTLDRMKKGEGMLGALATDNGVALDFKSFMRNLKQYGILRYRDSAAKPQEKPKESAPNIGGRHR